MVPSVVVGIASRCVVSAEHLRVGTTMTQGSPAAEEIPVTPTIITPLALGIVGCLSCNADLRAAILDHRFTLLLLTVAPVTLIGGFLAGWTASALTRAVEPGAHQAESARLAWAVAVTGAGLGALFDGILLHQILQVHDMVSNSLPPVTALSKGVNLFWSGIFDLSVFVLILVGVAAYRRHPVTRPVPPRFFWGAFLFGWGFFNCYDVLTFHTLFRYHDVVEVTDSPVLWNLSWLALGAVIAVIGFLALRSSRSVSSGGITG